MSIPFFIIFHIKDFGDVCAKYAGNIREPNKNELTVKMLPKDGIA
jgi:hypothetical protein